MSRLLAGVRAVLFWVHLSLGVAAGLVILLMSVTGVLLGFERQLIAAIDGAPRVEVGTARLPLDTLLARSGVRPDAVASVAMRAAPSEPVVVRFRDRERSALTVDPYTGAALAAPTDGPARAFFASMRRWHRWVGATGGAWRDRWRAVTGAANLAFFFIVCSGLVLWVPRRWTVAAVRNVAWFRRGLSPKARDFNWHNTIGLWTAVPLALIVAAGVFISYDWPERWLDRVLGSPAERAAAIAPTPAEAERGGIARRPAPGGADADGPASPALPLEPLAAAAVARIPAWQSLTITLPRPGESQVRVAVAEGNTYRPDLRTTLVLDAASAAIVDVQDYASMSASRRIRSWARFGHTGEVFGLGGQLVATLATLGGAVLVLTGLALTTRRLRAWRRRDAAAIA